MFTRLTCRVLVCLFVAFCSACSAPETEGELLARASDALAAGKINEAVVDIKAALQQYPESSPARMLLGETYMVQRDADAAAAAFLRAHQSTKDVESQVRYAQALASANDSNTLLSLNDDENLVAAADGRYQAAIARAHSLEGDFDAARAALNTALSLDSNDPYIRISEALVLMRTLGDPFDAADILARVTDAHPDNDEAWSLRADIARYAGDTASAAEWYAKTAELNPFRIAERLHLVGALIDLGDTDSANKVLAQLEKSTPNHPGVNFARGRLLVDEGNYKEGLAELNRVLGELPDHNATLYIAASANIQQGNFSTAQRQLEKIASDQPRHTPARLQLAALYQRKNDPRSAERLAREILQEDDMNIPAMRLLAVALATQGLYAESAQIYQEVATLAPESMSDRAGLGAAQLLSGETDAGLTELKKALEMQPKNAALRERLISIYLAAGDVDSARAAVTEYAAISEDPTRAQNFAARVAIQAGDPDKAQEIFESVVANHPGNTDANSGLAIMALSNNNLDEARARFNAILDVHPDNAQTLMNIAVLEERAGNSDAMVTALEQAIAADATALRPRLALSRYQIAQGDPREAARMLEAVREQYSDEYELHQELTNAYLASQQTLLAASSGRQMLRLRPNDLTTLAQVARTEQLDGHPGKAREHAEKALTLAPNNVELRKLLVETLLAENKLDRAATELAKLPEAVRAEPRVAVIASRLAMFQQRPVDAEAILQSVFDTQPTSAIVLLLNTAKWMQNKRDEAIGGFESWLEEHPDEHAVRNELAAWQLAMGDEDAARANYEILRGVAPDNALVLNNLAWLNRESDPDKALEYAEHALKVAPESVQVMDTYAMVQRSRGNIDEALELSERAVATESRFGPDLQFNRALILIDADREADAIEILEALVTKTDFAKQAEVQTLLDSIGAN